MALENNIIKERISALRQNMKKAGVHYYLVTTADPHGSEYINDYFKEREFLSGFTGSNGDLLVGEEECLLWTDGRYFVQAETELDGTGIILMKSQQPGVPGLEEYLKEHVKEGMVLGFYGLCVSSSKGKYLSTIMQEKQGKVVYEADLAESVYGAMRPSDSENSIEILSEDLTGESCAAKLIRIRAKMKEKQSDYLMLSKLDDQMWLFNIRGRDIECNPVAYSYTLITEDKTQIFLKEGSVDDQVKKYLDEQNIELYPYGTFVTKLSEELEQAEGHLGRKANVMIDPGVVSYTVYQIINEAGSIVEDRNPTEMMKAVKNQVEITHLKQVYLKDSLALTRFIRYIKEHRNDSLTECEAAEILLKYRQEIKEFRDLSFPTISAYGPNAAMMHYEAEPGKDAVLKPEGIYLVDSGGQYEGGTTDVTRSIVLGELTKEIKCHYTLAVMGMLRLQNAVFLHGCTGRNLDILAREPLWQKETDYKCGTGHGIGYMLNVHEGPQRIGWQQSKEVRKEAVIEAGMLISDEPGVYIAGKYGIRIENILLCIKKGCNDDGQFMGFEPLTLVPIDLNGIDISYMERRDAELLNRYHRLVYEKLSPFLSQDEREWLRNETKEIIS